MMQSSTRTVEIDGWRGCVSEVGQGQAILLLPSLLARARGYRPAACALAEKGFRVICVESPGAGDAPKLPEPWNFSQYARWIAALVEKENLTLQAVIGHSNSGPLAMMLAARAPHHVRRLVLVDSVGADFGRSLLGVLAGRAVDAAIEWRLTLRGWHHVLYTLARHPANFISQVRRAVAFDASPGARHVKAPVLIAWGRRDHTTPPRCAMRFYEMLPTSRIYLCEAGSHDWLVTHPTQFAQATAAFVAGEELPHWRPPAQRTDARSARRRSMRHRGPEDRDPSARPPESSPGQVSWPAISGRARRS